jgi:hypothetical protein
MRLGWDLYHSSSDENTAGWLSFVTMTLTKTLTRLSHKVTYYTYASAIGLGSGDERAVRNPLDRHIHFSPRFSPGLGGRRFCLAQQYTYLNVDSVGPPGGARNGLNSISCVLSKSLRVMTTSISIRSICSFRLPCLIRHQSLPAPTVLHRCSCTTASTCRRTVVSQLSCYQYIILS